MNDGILNNLYLLRKDMRANNWIKYVYSFYFKKHKYFILITDYKSINYVKDLWLLKLEFIDAKNTTRTLVTMANSYSLSIKLNDLRHFFHIDYSPNLGDLTAQFYSKLNNQTPILITQPNQEEISILINSLDKQDKQNNGKYCIGIKRNPIVNHKQFHRTWINSFKARLLRPHLYHFFEDDPTISFCFSIDKNKEQTDQEIINSLSNR